MRKPNIFTDQEHFMAAVMDTPMGAVCVKKRGKTLQELFDDEYGHGVLVRPAIVVGMVHGPEELGRMLREDYKEPFVTVRGHGWDMEKPFVWCGTTEQFNATWVVD